MNTFFPKWNFLSLLIIVLLVACAPSEKVLESQKEDLRLTVDQFNRAFKEGNKAKIESFIAKKYIHSNGANKAISRDTWLNYIEKRATQIQNKEIVLTHYEMTEQEITIYKNWGIVTGKISAAGKNKNGAFNNAWRVTNIWVKEKGGWKRTGFHDGKITK
jgi:hypothetical protein